MKLIDRLMGFVAVAGWSGAIAGADLPVPCGSGACGAGNPDVFVTAGQATYSTSGSVGTIEQLSDRAILNWQQFNVANGAKVVFKQPRDISVALNRIYDQSPSQILGAVTANGQIYLINPNGMIFGENARVNVNTLVASSLDIPDSVFNGPGLAGAINQGGGVAALSAASGPRGDIDVAHGAVLETVDGGRIFIFAPRVVNEGSIVTPGGQTILAASKDKIYLEFSTDPAVRGFLVEVATGGEAVNLGEIVAERGNVTMAGILVRQQGVISATTSVRENGSIRLLARDNVATIADQSGNHLVARSAGELDIGAGSTTSVLPDTKSDVTAVDDQVQQPSSIELMGKQVHIGAGAQLKATGGQIDVTATAHPNDPLHPNTPQNDASLIIDADARIDVSGDTSTVVAMSRNQVDLDLRSNELADSPLQRGGVLQGQTVSIDVRKGTPVANVDKAIANVKRGIGERLSTGGTVKLGSEGSMQLAQGSVIDVSGGSVTYESGSVSTSKLISNGKVVDISDADPNATYSAVFSGTTVKHSDWGVTENFVDPTGLANAQWEAGYVEGKDAGSLTIVAHALSLDGSIEAGTVSGIHQRQPTAALSGDAISRPYQQLAQRGTVSLTLNPDINSIVDVTLGDTSRFEGGVLIRPDWISRSGLGSFNLRTYGSFVYGNETRLTLPGDTAFAVTAGSIEMDGTFVSPSGSFTATSRGATAGNAPITIGATALVNVAGWWINDSPALRSTTLLPTWIDGGSITFAAGGDFVMRQGSMLDVSGGAWLNENGALADGVGGTISLGSRAGIDTRFLPQAGLRGFALHQGGTLRFDANSLVLYDAPPEEFIQPPVFVPTPDGPQDNPLPLDFLAKIDATIPGFFLQLRGFENFQFVSNRYGTVVAPGANLYPLQQNYQLSDRDLTHASGTYLADFASVGLLPVEQRRPANLTLAFERDLGSTPSGSVVVMPGARIQTDIGGAINLRSEGSLLVQGVLAAPAGSIRLALEAPRATAFPYIKNQVLWVADGAALLTPGAFLPQLDPLGRAIGDVLPGGTITLDAAQGFVVTEAGSVFDVGGTARKLDIARTSADLLEPTWVASDSGAVHITVAEGGLIDGTFNAQNSRAESRADVRGGTFDVTFDPNRRRIPSGEDELTGPDLFPTVERNLVVTDDVSAPAFQFGAVVPTNLLGRAEVSIGDLASHGFDSVALSAYELFGVVGRNRGADARLTFDSSVDATFGRFVGLNAPSIEAAPGTTVALHAPLARVGYDFIGTATNRTPAAGSAQFSLGASTLDLVGNVIFDGFSHTSFAVDGDVRLLGVQPDIVVRQYVGSLQVAGDLNIGANRIYPTTLTQYSIDVLGDGSTTLTFGRRGSGDSPLFSVGGSLDVTAPNIDVEGRIYAPQGQIALNAANDLHVAGGAVVSVALQDDVTLFGRTQAGIDWIYPFPGQRLQIIDRLPDKAITLDGASVALDAGSTVDLSGGGKVMAYEFTPGPGGSIDVLDAANAGKSFVIVPTKNLPIAPYEPLESAGFAYAQDAGVQLGAIAGLAGGEYAMLPARYALLPGAMLVTPVEGTLDMIPGEVRYDVDGAPIVAGRFTVMGNASGDSRYTGFKIQPGTFAEKRSDYLKTDANKFFAGRVGSDGLTSSTPNDAGDVSVSGVGGLTLDGSVSALGADKGRAGRLDVIADRIAIVAQRDAGVAGYVSIAAADINAAQVGSITLGASGARTASGLGLDVRASSVLVSSGVDLVRPELVLAATGDITVADGARVAATGSSTQAGETLGLESGAAALVVSSRAVDVVRSGSGGAGKVVLESGSSVEASGSLDISVATDAVLDGHLSATGAGFAIDAQHLALGDGASAASETRLSGATLASLNADKLQLSSRDGLAVYGAVNLTAPDITLRGPGIDRASDDASLSVTAGRLSIGNTGGSVAGAAPASVPGGAVSMTANEIEIADGTFEVRGFAQVGATAKTSIVGSGRARLTATGDIALATPELTTRDGSSVEIAAVGTVDVVGAPNSNAAALSGAGVGGSVLLSGRRVAVDTAIAARSGTIEVLARDGDVELRDGARLDASGVSATLGNRVVESDGGRIVLASQSGNVTASAGSALNVAAGGTASNAGSIDIAAAAGRVAFASALVGGAAADFSVDAGSVVDVEALNARVEAAGFAGERSYRQRQGDLTFDAATTMSAHRLELEADSGAVSFDGVANLLGVDASAVISGASGVAIGGQISATQGGNVTINALADGATIALAPTARADLGGGVLNLRMRDDGTVGQRVFLPATGVGAATNVDLVTFFEVADGVFDANDQATLRALLDASSSNLGALRGVLPSSTSLSLSTMVSSAGNLNVVDAMDLIDWRFGDRPGTFELRSGGDLNLLANISDGFAAQSFQFQGEDIPVMRPTVGPSYGYAFVAGADSGSADPLKTHAGVGNVTIGDGTRIRTGSGDIAIHAGGSLVFASARSSLYTAGESTGTGGFDDVLSYAFMHDAQYPTNGGAIDIVVGGNVVGAKTRQLMSDYMARFGGAFFDQSIPTMVGIVFDYNFGPDPFGQNIGSFGGGAVRIKAGGDVTDLSVIVPETLQHAGDVDASFDPFHIAFTDNAFTRRGRTTLDVESGGDILGGLYYLGSGAAKISAAGSIAKPSTGPGMLLATDDAAFDVSARGDVWIESMFNPTMLPQSPSLQLSPETSYFFSYTDASRLDVMSLAGRVTFSNDVEAIRNSVDFSNETRADRPLDIYPSHVSAVALTDSIQIVNGMTLYPGAGGFELLAAQDILGPLTSLGTLYLPDTDPAELPNLNAPAADLVGTELRLPRSGQGDAALIHAAVPVHKGDTSPSQIVAQHGSIDAPLLAIVSAEALRIQSNADIDIGRIEAQNVNATDITSVVSGADITIRSQRNPDTGQVITNSKVIRVGGGGALQVVAGRSVDLGSSEGLQTSGNLDNPALASGGADISVVTGAAADAHYDAFIDQYLVQSHAYDAALIKFVEARTGAAVGDSAQAVALLRAEPASVQQEFLMGVFFSEIKASGIAAAELIAQKAPAADVEAAYAPGRLAISTLFPEGANYAGDLRLFFSQIATLDGGNIKLIVPGGIVNAGLATTSISSKKPSELGIVAQRAGSIDVYASGDVQVNQSRVFTLSGGDINMWSNLGNIDAGRGAKTALATPGLSVVLGENDSVEKIVPPDISGSGIAAAAGAEGELPDIVLSTPNGVVDAGDAGIRTPGRLFTAATEFLGRDNVDVGSFVGAPVGTVSLSADLAGVGNSAASASQSLAQAAVEDSGAAASVAQSMSQTALGWLEVFLEGYGDADKPCDADRDPSCRAKVQ